MNYYNEFDPYAAQWLRNLIDAGHLPKGEVDTRSIKDVSASDLTGFVQCHFFAGLGGWSHALRLARWPENRPVWTGSCPCQPFSAAGAGGGVTDERHLWPVWFNLIRECRPDVIFGEQVEAAIRHGWLDLVQADLEGIGYAVAAAGVPAAGFGAPHIRQRLWFVADAELSERGPRNLRSAVDDGQTSGRVEGADRLGERRDPSGLGNNNKGLEGQRGGHQAEVGHRDGAVRSASASGESGGVADTTSEQCNAGRVGTAGNEPGTVERPARLCAAGEERPGPTNGHWRDADWLHCRDGKWRPVEPGTFPLAHGATARVGRLRAYGNAIVPQVAQVFIEAYLET